MSEDKLSRSSLIGAAAVFLLGSINHFIFEWTGRCPFIGVFTSVNESTWEHMKLFFFPFAFYIIAEFFIYGHKIKNFLFSRTAGALSGLIFIPAAFYAYTGMLGRNYFLIDILIFAAACILSFTKSSARIISAKESKRSLTVPAILLLIGIGILFAGFTFFPPEAPLFADPTLK